ncbi:5-oxoprolinase subunit PxpA [Rhodococcus sp. IEGM 1408]|uniref:LamB/YcsF family protein n=1 Tax=Rhodococcus sp. IEGM 1408 TaxID=3082220 RepID=UPI002953E730|nr:5-oxoprolinase subunit PxpA [Rhodococcus sp. IEGM 1408]MDV8001664.1 5-oxoprolinase subunit PxpA [Rhodococcus sp. IEGM 1408]
MTSSGRLGRTWGRMGGVRRIDLNCDLGEVRRGTPRWSASLAARSGADPGDVALLDVVTSANVACGFHAGNRPTMMATAVAAAERGVALGAHPSYRDGANFGRVHHEISRDEVARLVLFQLVELDMAARRRGTRVRYVKPHGALYNRIARDAEQAAGVVDAVLRYAGSADEEPLPILGLPGSVVLSLASAAGVTAVAEAFADRGYRADGTLLPRDQPGAVLTDVEEVAARVLAIARGEEIAASGGSQVVVPAASVCVHGDTPGALDLARGVRAALEAAGVEVAPFVAASVSTPGPAGGSGAG